VRALLSAPGELRLHLDKDLHGCRLRVEVAGPLKSSGTSNGGASELPRVGPDAALTVRAPCHVVLFPTLEKELIRSVGASPQRTGPPKCRTVVLEWPEVRLRRPKNPLREQNELRELRTRMP